MSTSLSSSTSNSVQNPMHTPKLDPNLNMPMDEGGGRKSAYNKSEKYKNIGWDSVQLSGTNSFIKPTTNSQAYLPMHSKVQESVTEIHVDVHSQKYHSEFIPITPNKSVIVERNYSEARTEESEQNSEQNPIDSLQRVEPTFFESNFIQLAESKLNRFDTFNGTDEVNKNLRKQDTTPNLRGNYSGSEDVDMAESAPDPIKNNLSPKPSGKKAKNKDGMSVESDRLMIEGLGSSSGFSMDRYRGEKSPNAQFIETDAERSPQNRIMPDSELMIRNPNGGSNHSNVKQVDTDSLSGKGKSEYGHLTKTGLSDDQLSIGSGLNQGHAVIMKDWASAYDPSSRQIGSQNSTQNIGGGNSGKNIKRNFKENRSGLLKPNIYTGTLNPIKEAKNESEVHDDSHQFNDFGQMDNDQMYGANSPK